MFRLARPTLNAAKAPIGQRSLSKATFVGRLGAAPEIRETANGSPYVTYKLAVNKPIKKDSEGNILRDEQGYPVRDTNWFTIFSFKPTASQYLPNIPVGTQLLVEATLDSRPPTADGRGGDVLIREISHQVISKKKEQQQEQQQ